MSVCAESIPNQERSSIVKFQKLRLLVIPVSIFCIFAWRGVSLAQTLRFRASYSAFDATFLPLWVAEEKKIFKSVGLDLEISYGRGGSSTAQSLQAKSIDVAVCRR